MKPNWSKANSSAQTGGRFGGHWHSNQGDGSMMMTECVTIPVAINIEAFEQEGTDKQFIVLPFCPGSKLAFLVCSRAIPMV